MANGGGQHEALKLEMATNSAGQPAEDWPRSCAWRWMRSTRTASNCYRANWREPATKRPEQQALLERREQQVSANKTFQATAKYRLNHAAGFQSQEQEAQRSSSKQAGLQQQFASAQTNLQSAQPAAPSKTVETLISKEKFAAMEAETRKQAEQAAAMQQQFAQLSRSNQMVLAEKQQLANQLLVAETEKRSATDASRPHGGRG